KRLGQIVVGAQFQAQDAMHLGRPGAGDDDGGVARHGPRALADFQTVDAGQHQVQHQRVPVALFQATHAVVAVGGVFHLVAFVAQVQAQQFGNVGVVFNNQHAAGGVHGRLGGRNTAIVANPRAASYHNFFKFA